MFNNHNSEKGRKDSQRGQRHTAKRNFRLRAGVTVIHVITLTLIQHNVTSIATQWKDILAQAAEKQVKMGWMKYFRCLIVCTSCKTVDERVCNDVDGKASLENA